MKKSKILILCMCIMLVLFAAVIASKWDAIFQCGNPVPYLSAMVKLSDENTFEAVPGVDGVYVTRQGDKQRLFQMVCDTYSVELKDQLGSGYLFSDGEKNYTVGSEIYWGRYTVWTLPFDDHG